MTLPGTNFQTGTAGGANPMFVDSGQFGLLVTAASAALVTGSGYQIGCLLIDTTIGKLFINTGNTTTPTWTSVGSQT